MVILGERLIALLEPPVGLEQMLESTSEGALRRLDSLAALIELTLNPANGSDAVEDSRRNVVRPEHGCPQQGEGGQPRVRALSDGRLGYHCSLLVPAAITSSRWVTNQQCRT